MFFSLTRAAATNKAKITDPYKEGYSNHWYELEDVYEVNHDHFRSAIIH